MLDMLLWKINQFFTWLDDWMPVTCVLCNKMVAKKNITHVQTTLGNYVPLCLKCYSRMFHPYSETNEQ
jgi:hypothetical protein